MSPTVPPATVPTTYTWVWKELAANKSAHEPAGLLAEPRLHPGLCLLQECWTKERRWADAAKVAGSLHNMVAIGVDFRRLLHIGPEVEAGLLQEPEYRMPYSLLARSGAAGGVRAAGASGADGGRDGEYGE